MARHRVTKDEYHGLVLPCEPDPAGSLARVAADPLSLTGVTPIFGPPRAVRGVHADRCTCCVSVGIETFAVGCSVHFDSSRRTLFKQQQRLFVFRNAGKDKKGSEKAKHSITPV